MSTRQQLLTLLTDGRFHSGTELGVRLGISRAAVNKSIQGLVDRGLDIHSVNGKGYRWASPTRLLDQKAIQAGLDAAAGGHNLEVIVLEEVESTSSYLVNSLSGEPVMPSVCIAEHQTGGRGRRGRNWLANPYQNIELSISWRYESGPSRLSGLSIAVGIAILRVLGKRGIAGVQLKWPNDVLYADRKLAGILVDLRGEAEGPTSVVVGVGLNIRLHDDVARQLDQPWIDLATISDDEVNRNELAVELVSELVGVFAGFSKNGLDPYMDEWRSWHAYENKPVKLLQADREITGTVCGIDRTGALQLNTGTEIISVHSGEVSLRAT